MYGPVPSRRLGRSLGVDLVPFKTCSFNCVYCQLGPTASTTVERRAYVPADELVADVRDALAAGAAPDYVTLGGSGEPTLHDGLGDVARRVKRLSDVPVALLTNGALFFRPDVRRDAARADVVLPSLDAPNAELFARINRPHESLSFERYVDGLAQFRGEYTGQIWLEVFVLEGINDGDEHMAEFRRHLARIRPDKVHLNTAVRPTAESGLRAVSPEALARLCEALGPRASVVAEFAGPGAEAGSSVRRADVLGMLRRRPCTLADIAAGLSVHRNEVVKYIDQLLRGGEAVAERRGSDTYYRGRD